MALNSLFLNPAGLLTALILLPFLLLYLIKPKPRHAPIPSLLFFVKDTGRSAINSLFRNWLRDLLFLFQLLLILLVVAASARPFIEVPRVYLVEQTVLILDVSASMRADGDARFTDAIRLAKENLGKENTIILAKGSPIVIAERVSASVATKELERLSPTETTTALTEALRLAADYAGTGSRVAVISDFLPTQGDKDYDTAAAALEGRGALVDYLPVAGGSRNAGIIDLLVGPVSSSVWIKNYEQRPVELTLSISDAEQKLLLARGETKEVSFTTPAGVTELKIREQDDLAADNLAWISTPEKNRIKLLTITNDERGIKTSNLLLALSVIAKNFPTSFDISYTNPPKSPSMNHDVYIVSRANLDFLLPGYVKELQEKVEQGAGLLIIDQPALFSLDWLDLLPVEPAPESQGTRATILPGEQSGLTTEIEFGQAASYTRVAAKEGGVVLAKAENGDPIIVLRRKGRGIVLYYGLDDQKASFSKDPSYPVFWRRIFDLLTDRPSLANLNVRTGSVLALPKTTTIKTPTESVTTQLLPLDRAGLYILPDRTIAANLLSDAESSIIVPESVQRSSAEGDGKTEKAPKELTLFLLWGAVALLLLEILYLKYRGDL